MTRWGDIGKVGDMMQKAPEIVVIGGGTGSFTLLQALKHITPDITAIVNMSDDGGSTGKLRDEYGVLPPGDVRQCLVALSELPEVRDLFSYRFGEGSFKGQSLGNIMLSGLELQYDGDFVKAIDIASSMLNIVGKVVPVTLDKHQLVMDDGTETIMGESRIGHRRIQHSDAVVRLEPAALINPDAQAAIAYADLVVIAPGNLYGSLLPALAVSGMREALRATKAQKVMVSNLVTKPGQTDGWHVVDYVKVLERYIGAGQIDAVLYNSLAPSQELLDAYAQDQEYPVGIEQERFGEIRARAIGAPLVSDRLAVQDKNDTLLKRTLIRHDAIRVARQLVRLYNQCAEVA